MGKKRVLIGICIFLVLVVGYATYYLNTYYRSSEEADKIISKYQYDTYYMGGHSLGGVMAILMC